MEILRKATFSHSFGRITQNYVARSYAETVPFPQNLHSKKLGKITVFFAVYFSVKTHLNIFLPICFLYGWVLLYLIDICCKCCKTTHESGKRESRLEIEASYDENVCIFVKRLHSPMCSDLINFEKCPETSTLFRKGFWSFHSSYGIVSGDPEDWRGSTLCWLNSVCIFIRTLFFGYKTFFTVTFGSKFTQNIFHPYNLPTPSYQFSIPPTIWKGPCLTWNWLWICNLNQCPSFKFRFYTM